MFYHNIYICVCVWTYSQLTGLTRNAPEMHEGIVLNTCARCSHNKVPYRCSALKRKWGLIKIMGPFWSPRL